MTCEDINSQNDDVNQTKPIRIFSSHAECERMLEFGIIIILEASAGLTEAAVSGIQPRSMYLLRK